MELTRLFLLLLVVTILVSFTGPTTVRSSRTPGFIYTRTRGRCTPQYWISRAGSWPKMVPESSTIAKVFGSRAFERFKENLTVMEAVADTQNDDAETPYSRLVKHSTAALLNSYARRGYPYSSWEVKTLLIQGMVSEKAAELQTQKFIQANQNCV